MNWLSPMWAAHLTVFQLPPAGRRKWAGVRVEFSACSTSDCSARAPCPSSAVKQNRWMYEREGAYLKASVWRDGVDLQVDRMTMVVAKASALCFQPHAVGISIVEPVKVNGSRFFLPGRCWMDSARRDSRGGPKKPPAKKSCWCACRLYARRTRMALCQLTGLMAEGDRWLAGIFFAGATGRTMNLGN